MLIEEEENSANFCYKLFLLLILRSSSPIRAYLPLANRQIKVKLLSSKLRFSLFFSILVSPTRFNPSSIDLDPNDLILIHFTGFQNLLSLSIAWHYSALIPEVVPDDLRYRFAKTPFFLGDHLMFFDFSWFLEWWIGKMSQSSVDLPPKGGFSFDLCKRNDMLIQKGLKAPGFLKTGTTIVGLIFQVCVSLTYCKMYGLCVCFDSFCVFSIV